MQFDGAWRVCDDGIVRPVLRADVRAATGVWLPIFLLVDSGADRTVFSANVVGDLGFKPVPAIEQVEGVGGAAESVRITTSIRLTRENGDQVLFNGDYVGITDLKALDMSVLGRDLTNLFAVIVDRPQDVVCLLGGNHRYAIVEK